METQFSEHAAILESIYVSKSTNFSAFTAWKVAVKLNTEQNVIVIKVLSAEYSLEFQSQNRQTKQSPYERLEYDSIKHFYQFDKYANTVVLAVSDKSQCPHYQALAFIDVDNAVLLCHLLARKIPWPEFILNSSTDAYNADLLKQAGTQENNNNFESGEYHPQSNIMIASKSRKSQPRFDHRTQIRDYDSDNILNSSKLPSNKKKTRKVHADRSVILANKINEEGRRSNKSRRTQKYPVGNIRNSLATCVICESNIQPEVCEHCKKQLSSIHIKKEAMARLLQVPIDMELSTFNDMRQRGSRRNEGRLVKNAQVRQQNTNSRAFQSPYRSNSEFPQAIRGKMQHLVSSSSDDSSWEKRNDFSHQNHHDAKYVNGNYSRQRELGPNSEGKHVTIGGAYSGGTRRVNNDKREYTIHQSSM